MNGQSAGYQGMGVSGYNAGGGERRGNQRHVERRAGRSVTGGPQVNVIQKQGGNSFSGNMFFNYAGDAFQTENLSAAQKTSGLTPISLEKLWDVNPAFGGPVLRGSRLVLCLLPPPGKSPADQHVHQRERRRPHEMDVRTDDKAGD